MPGLLISESQMTWQVGLQCLGTAQWITDADDYPVVTLAHLYLELGRTVLETPIGVNASTANI